MDPMLSTLVVYFETRSTMYSNTFSTPRYLFTMKLLQLYLLLSLFDLCIIIYSRSLTQYLERSLLVRLSTSSNSLSRVSQSLDLGICNLWTYSPFSDPASQSWIRTNPPHHRTIYIRDTCGGHRH